jgi:hypothetical protein
MKLKRLFTILIAVQLSGCLVTLDSDALVAQITSMANSNLPLCTGSYSSRWSNCVGTFTSNYGDKYVGEFKDGKFNGQGSYISANSRDKYFGEFRDGSFNGQGIRIFANGNPSQEGIYENGNFILAQRIPDHIAGRTSLAAPSAAQIVPTTTLTTSPIALQASRFERMITNGICDLLSSNSLSDIDRQLALAEMRRRWNESCSPNYRSGVQNASSAQPAAPRQAEVARSTLNLTASASSPDSNGVLTLNITTNSDTASLRVNGDEVGSRADGRYSVQRFAQIGDNNFEVIATDRFGNTRRQSISVSRQAADNTVRFASLNPIAVRARPANNAVAIIIGIQDYRRVPKAEFASNDARAFYDYAVRGLGVRPENIKLLLDQEADDVEILGAFRNWLPLKARKGQTDVYVFFSGHGLPSDDGSNLYMLPYGVDKQFLDRTAIKQSELIASLQAVSPRSVTMFMDACYSGQSRTGETLLASARPISIQSKASSYPANFNVISASAPDQLASSSPDLKHGMFSYFLMKGMEGEADENKDGNITMAEMQSYLKEYVGKKAMSLNRTQVPQLTGDQSRVLVSR